MTTDGQPVAGARVSIYGFESSDARRTRILSASPEATPIATTQTDAKGAFSIASPKDPVVQLSVVARAYDPASLSVERDEETGAIVLRKNEWKSGTVTAGGKPLAGATIVINYMGGYEHVTKTGDDGRYEAPDVKNARGLVAVHPDYAIDDESLGFMASPNGPKLNRTLVAGTQIKGRVAGADGQTPAAKAVVSVDGWPLATTGDDGAFTIEHASPKWKMLTARKDAFLGQRAAAAGESQTVRLAKGATVTGRVLDSKTKLPVAGAIVRTVVPRMGGDSTSSVTDAKGAYSLLVQPGTYMLIATHPGYEDLTQSNVNVVGGQTASKDVSVTPRARITGVVVDEERKPVAVAMITAEDAGDPMAFAMRMVRGGNPQDAASGPDGRFSIRVRADSDLRLRASKKGLPVAKTETMKLTPSERKTGVVLTIPSGVEVTGRVTDPENNPLSGVAVMAAEAEAGRGGPMQRMMMIGLQQADEDTVRTASDGTFSLRLKEGTYDFTFKREGYAPASVRAQSVAATANNVVDASLNRAAELKGRVLRNGSGVDGVMVSAMMMGSDARAVTTPDGAFSLEGLPAGNVRLMIRKEDEFIQEMRSVTAPVNDLVVELPTGGRVIGRVVEKGTNKPVTQFQAGISRSRGAGGMVMMMGPPQLKSFTSDDGSFTLENVPAGAQDLVANAAGYAGGRMNVTVEEGKTLSDVVIELDTGTRLTGRVTGPNGQPLSDVMVRVAMSQTSGMMRTGVDNRTTTDANGEYTLEALEAGEETIEFTHAKHVSTRKNVTLKGREVKLDAQLSGGERVTGMVVTESGSPVPDVEVYASAAGGSRRSARTNASGTFEFESLAQGRYRFSAAKAGYTEGVLEDFDITGGAPVRITLKTGGTIYGRVAGLTREELANAAVEARNGRNYASASVDASGNYKLEGAPLGTVQLVASVMSPSLGGRRTTQMQTVEVEAGSSRQVDLEFRSDVSISGRVTHNGAPLQGASVMFSPRGGSGQANAGVSTDDQGRFTVTGLEDGDYNVTVLDMQRLSPYTTTYKVRGSGTFNIEYETGSVRGRVLDAMTNEPIAAVNVQLRSTDPNAGFGGQRGAMTDANGTFIFEAVSPGSYVANAAKDGFGNQTMDVSVGQSGVDGLELKLARNDGVTLKVVDGRDGRALDATVTVFDLQGRVVHETRTMFFGGGEGATDKRLPLAPGSYTASVFAMGYAPRTVSFRSPSNQSVPLTPGGTLLIRSTHSTRMRARLIDSSGMPYPRYGSRPPSIDLNPSPGTTTLQNVAPGTYTIQLLGDNDAVLDSAQVVVPEGQTVTAEI